MSFRERNLYQVWRRPPPVPPVFEGRSGIHATPRLLCRGRVHPFTHVPSYYWIRCELDAPIGRQNVLLSLELAACIPQRYNADTADNCRHIEEKEIEPKSNRRVIGVGSQILRALNLKKITVLGTPTKYNAVSGFDIEITGFTNE